MTTRIDRTYRNEKLLNWERKSLTGKFSIFSLFKKSTWRTLGIIVLGLFLFAFVIPLIPPRYYWSNWTPATTTDEYLLRVKNFLVLTPLVILALFVLINTRNIIDLGLGIKKIANFKITDVLNIGVIKILILNHWRLFRIRTRQQYFQTVEKGQIITIKRTGTFRLIDYYIRDEKTFNDEQDKKH